MNICPECGKEAEADSKFCPSCGVIFRTTLAAGVPEPKPQPVSEPDLRNIPTDSKRADTTEEADHSQKKCPECGNRVERRAVSCNVCGLIFYTKPAQPIHSVSRQPGPVKHSFKSPILIILIAMVVFMTIYYLPEIGWVLQGDSGSEPKAVKALPSDLAEFDLSIDLATQPSGLSWNENEFIVGNKRAGSFIRISRAGDQYMVRQQRVGAMSPLTWNGKQFVGYRDSGLFHSFKKHQFTSHDAATLNIVREYSVSETIGGLAWDGTGYWAAQRNDNLGERAFLYRLDENFKPVNKMVLPSSNCRGLAWDGSNLWFLDDRTKKILVLDVNGVSVRTIESFEIPIRSPSGIAFDGRTIWISDYDQRRLLRLKSTLPTVWTFRKTQTARDTSNPPRNYDIYRGAQKLSNNNVEISSFSARLASNALYASWDIHLGHNLFDSKRKNRKPAFAKLTITVDGGALSAPVARVYDASAGRSFRDSELILSSLGPGTYRVGLFIYLQYRDEKGIGRILSKSIPPLKIIN